MIGETSAVDKTGATAPAVWRAGAAVAYDAPILNQSSIDISPAIDHALGWRYPSSGLVRVSVTGLP